MSALTWLHISDLHFQGDEAYDADVVLREFLKDVAERIEKDGLRPDLILVTGDLASSGRAAEYAQAAAFFDRLLQTTGLPRARLFPVPGNHDADRGRISGGARAIAASLADREAANALLADPGDRGLMMARLAGYGAFLNDYLAGHLAFDDEAYYYVKFPDLPGPSVAILGLNSAWLAYGGDEDYGKLALGERQVREALQGAEGADWPIALLHHPFDWLRAFDRDDTEAMLADNCEFVLHGHMHRAAATHLTSPDGAATVLAAGACYETRTYPNGYNFVRLDFEAGQGTVYLRTWSDRRGGFWTWDTTSYRNVEDGQYRFDLGRRSPGHSTTGQKTTGQIGEDKMQPKYRLDTVRELLVAAFTAEDFRRLFLYTSHPRLGELTKRFGRNAGLANMVDEAVEFCVAQDLLADLLAEVKKANPRQYAHYAPSLEREVSGSGTGTGDQPPSGTDRALVMARRTLAILEEQAAAYTALTIPAHLRIELEEQRRKVAELEARRK